MRSFSTQSSLLHISCVPPGRACVFFLRSHFLCAVFLRNQCSGIAVVFLFFYAAIFHAQLFYTASPSMQQWLTTGLCNLNLTVCGCRMFCHVFVVPHHPLLTMKIY